MTTLVVPQLDVQAVATVKEASVMASSPYGASSTRTIDADSLAETEWCLYHRIPEVIQELAYNIVIDRPADVEEYSRSWLCDLKRLMVLNGNARSTQGVNLTGVRAETGRLLAADPVRGARGNNLIDEATETKSTKAGFEQSLDARSVDRPRKSTMRKSRVQLTDGASEKQQALIDRIMKMTPMEVEELTKHAEMITSRKMSYLTGLPSPAGMGNDKKTVRSRNRVFGDLLMISTDVMPLTNSPGTGGIDDAPVTDGSIRVWQPAGADDDAPTPSATQAHPAKDAEAPAAERSNRAGHRRRIAVSAAPAVKSDDLDDLASAIDKLQTVDKTEEEIAKLREVMRACTAFNNFEAEQLEQIISVMHKESFAAGYEILSQGQPGRDTFFLIIDGDVEIIKNGKFVCRFTRGNYFGELELMYSTGGCAATVKSVTPVQCYALKKETYQLLLMRQTIALREANLDLIKNVDFFKDLSDYNLLVLAEAFSTKSYNDGEKLIRLGEPGEWMHIIVSGEIVVMGREEGTGKPFEIVRRTQGHVVGELEFLFHHQAVADVVAVGRVRAARLSRKHFESAIGKTVDVLAAQIARGGYENYLKKADEKVIKQIQVSTRKADRATGGTGRPASSSANAIGGAPTRTPETTALPLIFGTSGDDVTSPKAARTLSPIDNASGIALATANGTSANSAEALVNPSPHSNGEVIFGALDGTLYRFPLDPFQDDHICLVGMQEDGTIVHWSDGMAKLTQYGNADVLGKPIFSLLTDQANQRVCFELITAATEWIGDWDGFQDGGFHKRETLSFTSASQMAKPTLLVTVVPALKAHAGGASPDVVLMVGHEMKRKPPTRGIEFGPWFQSTFAPVFRAMVGQSTALLDPFKLFEGVLPQPRELKELQDKIVALNAVVDQFEPLVAIDAASLVDNWQPVNVATLFRRIQTNFATEISQHHNHLELDIDPTLDGNVEVFVDIVKLPEALTRLIHNANKANIGVTITVKARCHRKGAMSAAGGSNSNKQAAAVPASPVSPALPVSGNPYDEPVPLMPSASVKLLRPSSTIAIKEPPKVEQTADFAQGIDIIEFSVVDTGVGFSDSALERIASNPQARGVGLRNVIKAVQTMGGTYKVASTPGETTISMFLPLVEGIEQHADVAKTGETFTTVLVESDTVQRNFFCQYLWGRHHAVLPAQNWSDVLRMLQTSPVDVLIIDPDCIEEGDIRASMIMDGNTASNAIEMLRQYASKSVLIITSETMEDDVMNSFVEDGLLALSKPCSAPRFHLVVQKAEQQILRLREEAEKIRQLRQTFQQTNRGAWRKGKLLGKGAFGEVYEAIDVLTGGKMAVKIMKNNDNNKALMEEIRTMTKLQHDNIIHYFYCEENKTVENEEILIFMELAVGGVLQDKIKALGRGFDKATTAKYLRQILAGIEYIHEKGYVHCDIKSANVLMDAEDHCKLGDFGTAKLLAKDQRLFETRGTPLYMAPEVWNASPGDETGEGRCGYNQAADVWSLGCLVMEMATGKSPWAHLGTPVTVMNRISSLVAGVDDTPDLSPLFEIDLHVFEFVRACLDVDPEKRPTARSLQSLALITDSTDTSAALKMLQKAELMHVLNKFIAFESPPESEDDEDDFFSRVKHKSNLDEDSFFDSDEEDEEDDDDDDDDEPARAPAKPPAKVAAAGPATTAIPQAKPVGNRKSVAFAATNESTDDDSDSPKPAALKASSMRGSLRNLLAAQQRAARNSVVNDPTTGEVKRGQSIRREANPFFGAAVAAAPVASRHREDDVVDLLQTNSLWTLDAM